MKVVSFFPTLVLLAAGLSPAAQFVLTARSGHTMTKQSLDEISSIVFGSSQLTVVTSVERSFAYSYIGHSRFRFDSPVRRAEPVGGSRAFIAADSRGSVTVTVDRAAEVDISLYDCRGHRIGRVAQRKMPAGRHVLLPGVSLHAAGVYAARGMVGETPVSARFVVNR